MFLFVLVAFPSVLVPTSRCFLLTEYLEYKNKRAAPVVQSTIRSQLSGIGTDVRTEITKRTLMSAFCSNIQKTFFRFLKDKAMHQRIELSQVKREHLPGFLQVQ
jgi:hypothetical protein